MSNFSMRLHSCNSSKIDERMSCTGYWNCLTVHANGLAYDLVTLRCVLDGHVEVPHLADAEKDRYSSVQGCRCWYCTEELCDIEDAESNLPWRSLRLQK